MASQHFSALSFRRRRKSLSRLNGICLTALGHENVPFNVGTGLGLDGAGLTRSQQRQFVALFGQCFDTVSSVIELLVGLDGLQRPAEAKLDVVAHVQLKAAKYVQAAHSEV